MNPVRPILTRRNRRIHFLQMRLRAALCAAIVCIGAIAAVAQMNREQIQNSFPPERLMSIGVYYYPEAWPE